MAKVIPVGQPANEAERQAIKFLRDNLPDTYTLIHSFEIHRPREKQTYEVDIALIAPHSLFLIDTKGTLGHIDLYPTQWQPRGRQPYTSPLPKLRQNAKILKAFIKDQFPTQRDLDQLYTHAVILLTDPKTTLRDLSGKAEADDITHLDDRCLTYFKGKSHIPSRFLNDIRPLQTQIIQAIEGKKIPKSALPQFRDWQATEKLSTKLIREEANENDIQAIEYIEYRAEHYLFGKRNGTVCLRVYHVDPYKSEAERQIDQLNISNAYRALTSIGPHANIVSIREFFDIENGDRYILVTEDRPGTSLQQYLTNPDLSLTFDQKIALLRDTLEALNHAHLGGVIHRNLTPEAILISPDGHNRLTNFDYARAGHNRSQTIAEYAANKVDYAYQAPEAYGDPSQATVLSDLFSAGLIFYELFTGKRPFESIHQIDNLVGIFPIKPTTHNPNLATGFDDWLQSFCHLDAENRHPSAKVALHELNKILLPGVSPTDPAPIASVQKPLVNLRDLPTGYVLNEQYIIEKPLGSGGFGTTYKAFDEYGKAMVVIKLIDQDRRSVFDRMCQEYQKLKQLNHPKIVQVLIGGRFPDETPYLLFPYLEGATLDELIINQSLNLEDAIQAIEQTAEGLSYVHAQTIYHQDIKPDNLYWTAQGIKILDFNVSVSDQDSHFKPGGTNRYIPPDFEPSQRPEPDEMIDRDLYALGITLYECITSQHPFNREKPPIDTVAPDPRELTGLEDLSSELVAFMQKAIAPHRSHRFRSAQDFRTALTQIKHLRYVAPTPESTQDSIADEIALDKPNFNPFVSYLLTLYSQSQQTNAGTRGLDDLSSRTYIPTRLDTVLLPAILEAQFKLVLISGNAGDGKTAFIQKLERTIPKANLQPNSNGNGSTFTHNSHQFRTNYDGSQDEGQVSNTAVLLDFFAPFQGDDPATWQPQATHIIAINEGRLIDFLTEQEPQFPYLTQLVRQGLRGEALADGIAVINLNLRSVVADGPEPVSSIFDRLIRELIKPKYWKACQNCDLKDRCYVHHNIRTLSSKKSGTKVIQRLKTLHELTHLRGRLHITLRDLRSALAYTIAGTRNCDQIHELYSHGTPESRMAILNGYYFNAWMGGITGNSDRLLTLLREIDIGATSSPNHDRTFAFLEPSRHAENERLNFSDRSKHDTDLLERIFNDLSRDYSSKISPPEIQAHITYVAMLRRRYYFERRDENWQSMLPYHSKLELLDLIKNPSELTTKTTTIITAINRGEGLRNPASIGSNLALRVRQVDRATIRSYRLFEEQHFSLHIPMIGNVDPFLEYLPSAIELRYAHAANPAKLIINLDVYEMLIKINQGYYPNWEEQQGIYRNVAVFKNILSAAPYQEVLLTETGVTFHSIRRDPQGNLTMSEGR
jgi:serine/threonine protein kinase